MSSLLYVLLHRDMAGTPCGATLNHNAAKRLLSCCRDYPPMRWDVPFAQAWTEWQSQGFDGERLIRHGGDKLRYHQESDMFYLLGYDQRGADIVANLLRANLIDPSSLSAEELSQANYYLRQPYI